MDLIGKCLPGRKFNTKKSGVVATNLEATPDDQYHSHSACEHLVRASLNLSQGRWS